MTKEVFLRQIKDHIQALSRRPENVLENIGITQKIYDLYILCDFLEQQDKQAAKQAELEAKKEEELQMTETIVDDSLSDPIPVSPTSDRIKQANDPLNFISTSDFKRKANEQRGKDAVYRETGRPLDIQQSESYGETPVPKTLNDKANSAQIQFSLNDKIGFIRELFSGRQLEFEDAIRRLEQFEHHSEALFFIDNSLKPMYNNWEGKEEFEERFLLAIAQKFV